MAPFQGDYILPDALQQKIQGLLDKYAVPGLSLCVVRKHGENWVSGVHSFGIRNVERSTWDRDSKQCIASASKVFVVASMGLLIDRQTELPGGIGGRLGWRTKVRDVLPDWELMEKTTESNATIEDLLSMRIGITANNAAFGKKGETADSIVQRMRFHRPAAPLRSVCIYSNDLFTTAGKIISVLSGMPYPAFVKQNILDPLGMDQSEYDAISARTSGKAVEGFIHYERDMKKGVELINEGNWGEECVGKLGQTGFWVDDDGAWFAAAGGLWTTGDNICLWIKELLQPQLISASVLAQINRSRITMSNPPAHPSLSTQFYGLGQYTWYYRGHRIVGHHGGLPGMYSVVLRLPDENTGLAVFSNDENYGNPLISTVAALMIDELTGEMGVDWEEVYMIKPLRSLPEYDPPPVNARQGPEDISGKYHSTAYGPLTITELSQHPSSELFKSLMSEYPGNTLSSLIQPGAKVYIGDLQHDLAGKMFFTAHDSPVFTRAFFKAEKVQPLDRGDEREYAGHVYMVGKCVVTDEGIGMFEDFWGQGGETVGVEVKKCTEAGVEESAEVWFQRV